MYFTIATNRKVAEEIRKQCEFDERMGNRSYKLGEINHREGHSVVQILAKNERIEPSDIFWLGHFSGSNLK
jgi:hypothetical protein